MRLLRRLRLSLCLKLLHSLQDFLLANHALLGEQFHQRIEGQHVRVGQFLKYPNLPMLESETVLHNAVEDGTRNGVFGLRANGRLYFNEPIPFGAIDSAAVLVRKETAEAEKAAAVGGAGAGATTPGGTTGEPQPPSGAEPSLPIPPPLTPTPSETRPHQLSLRVMLPWDKLADFVRGVLRPLKEDGAEIEVEVTLTARSEQGFEKTTLDLKVKETLDQIGATILAERQE